MSEIKGFARLRIHPGKLQEFKDLQAQCMAVVRAKDTGTLQYEVFFNDDSSECIVYERYRDSDALLEHFANLGALMTALFQVCSGSGEILGTPSPQLRTVRTHTCYLPLAFVRASSAGALALAIIREAMHARLDSAGFPPWRSQIARHERLCLPQELHLVALLQGAGWGQVDKIVAVLR
jgi:quinol monooxygenase YgiN